MASNPLILNGAGGGSRTHTRLPLPDFESGASAISPHRQPIILKYFQPLLQSFIF